MCVGRERLEREQRLERSHAAACDDQVFAHDAIVAPGPVAAIGARVHNSCGFSAATTGT